jgi:serine/threonine-protein kinase HipA
METWEEIALRLAGQAGIATPQHELIDVAGKAVTRKIDRPLVISNSGRPVALLD